MAISFSRHAEGGKRRPRLKAVALAALIGSSGAVLALCAGPASSGEPDAIDPEGGARGLVRAFTQAMISTELPVPVLRIGFKEGEPFRKGDLLVEFDCRRQRADLASAEAQQTEMRLTVENNKVLRQSQAVGRHELEISEARLAKAAAEAEALRVRLDPCVLTAPFDGHVLDLGLHERETAQPGKPYNGIIADGLLEVDLIVPADWLQSVGVGSELSFSVDETRSAHTIKVVRVGAAIDPLSQTAKLVAAFVAPATGVMPGMSGTAERSSHGQ